MVSFMDTDLQFDFAPQATQQALTLTSGSISLGRFSSKPSKNPEEPSLKSAIISWLKSLPSREKFKIFLIDSPKIAQIILKMYWKQQETGYKRFAKLENEASRAQEVGGVFLYEGFEKMFYSRVQHETEFAREKKKRVLEAEKEILANLKVLDINGIYDALCFPEPFLSDVDAVLRVFSSIAEDKLFLYENDLPYNLDETRYHFPEWFHPNQFQTISTWVVSYLENSIKAKFFKSRLEEPGRTLQRDNAEDFLVRVKNLKEFWKNNKNHQEKLIEESIVALTALKEDSSNLKEMIQNPELIKLYVKHKDKITVAGFSAEQISANYRELLAKDDVLIEKILFEPLNMTTSISSFCNKILQNKTLLLFTQSLMEPKDNAKKKKKKKQKKKAKNPETFLLFGQKPCVFVENPEKDKSSCEIYQMAQSLAREMIFLAVRAVVSPKSEQKQLERMPIKEKDHKTPEHIIEHQSETTCTKDTKSMTESDFPMIDDLAIFDEMDKQKLSKKQKKKLKKKKKNKVGDGENSKPETELILPREEKNSENSEESKEEKEEKSGKNEKTLPKQETQEKQEKPIETPTNQPKTPTNQPKTPAFQPKTPPCQPLSVASPSKPSENLQNAALNPPKTPELPSKPIENSIIENSKPLEKPKSLTAHIEPSKGNPNETEFIEVTKKSSKSSQNRDGAKRFAGLASRPEPNKWSSKGPTLVKKESFEDRFKIEKDSRKKTTEMNKSGSQACVNKPISGGTKPSSPISQTITSNKPINTTDIDLQETPKNSKEPELFEEAIIKTEHGATLCKKKHAKDVLMAKIKRKEIEKQQKTTVSIENAKIVKEKAVEILSNEAIEKKALNIINDPVVKKEFKSLSQKIFWRKMENDLNDFTEKIASECKRMKVFRVCVFDRIEFMVSSLFEKFGAHIKMYGSCVTGLELPYSDMDIGISGFEKISKYETESVLSRLLEHFSYMKWVKLCKPIFTATVPLLKLELDPTIAFTEFTYPNPPIDYINTTEKYPHLNVKGKSNKPMIIKVDISLENTSSDFPGFLFGENVGTLSTNLINHYLRVYPTLHKLIIVFKHFLYQKEYNKSYQGGISSYCMSLMIIAYLMEYGHKFNLESPELLTEIFHFYGKKFNPKETAISLKMKPSPFFKILPNTEFGKLIIYEPITNSKSLALNTYLIDKILSEFANVYERVEGFKLEFENRVKGFTYTKLKYYEKMSYSEIEGSKDFSDLIKTQVIEQIICEEF